MFIPILRGFCLVDHPFFSYTLGVEVYLSDYQDYPGAYQQIGQYIETVYQHKRIHSALGYLTPEEFEAEWLETHTQVEVVH